MSDAPAPRRAPAPTTLRSVGLTKIGEGRFKATNDRGGETFMGAGGDDPDFTPVELLLAAIAGCSAIDVDLITRKRRRQHHLRAALARATRCATSRATT